MGIRINIAVNLSLNRSQCGATAVEKYTALDYFGGQMSKSNVRHAMPHFTDDSSAGASE